MTRACSSSTTATNRWALRVYDPNKVGPDGKRGMQADGLGGDLAYAMQSRTDRAIPAMNLAPNLITSATGPTGGTTLFPPHINQGGAEPGDPFTPMLRTYTGDNVRLRVHAGGHEEEHNVTLHGVKWLQSGTGFRQQLQLRLARVADDRDLRADGLHCAGRRCCPVRRPPPVTTCTRWTPRSKATGAASGA